MGFFRRTWHEVRLSLSIILFVLSLAAAAVAFFFSTPVIVVSALSVSFAAGVGIALNLLGYAFVFFRNLSNVTEKLTYWYIYIIYGPLRAVILAITRGDTDIAVTGSRIVGVIVEAFVAILFVGSVVGALTWVPHQNLFQQSIDISVCQTYPVVAQLFRLGNLIIDFYNSIAEDINILGNILFEFAEDVFIQFLSLVWEGVVLIFRFIADPASALDNCTIYQPGQPIPELCPVGVGGNYSGANVCVTEELFCWALRVLDFIIVDVFERFLRILFPPVIADATTNVLEALAESALVFVDIFANAFANPINGLPFAGCSSSLPSGIVSTPSASRACFNNRTQCPRQRLICMLFYWFRVVFSTGSNFLIIMTEFFDNVLSDVFPPFLGKGIFTRILEFIGLIDAAIEIVEEFEMIVNGFITAITNPIEFTLNTLNASYNAFRQLISTNPIEAVPRLPQQLLSIFNPLGRQLAFLLEFIERIEIVTNTLSGAINAIRSIVNSILSGGGLFRRRLLAFDLGATGIPLNAPEHWIKEIEDNVGIYNLTDSVIYPLIEIYNNTLHEECDVEPDTLDRLKAKMDWLPNLEGMGNETMTQGQADTMRYIITRQLCAEGNVAVGSTAYHLATLSPRLDSSHVCHGILGDEALRHTLFGDTEGEWWDQWYKPCSAAYLASYDDDGNPREYSWMYMMEEESTRRSIVGYIKLENFRSAWNNVVGTPLLAEDEEPHMYHKPRSSFTPEENAKIDRDFYEHITRPRGMHKAQLKIDRARSAMTSRRNQTRRGEAKWGVDWGRLKINNTRSAHPVETYFKNRQPLNVRKILQVSTTRTFNLINDVIVPLAETIRKAVSFFLFIFGKLLGDLGLVAYQQIFIALIEFMKTYELSIALQAIRDFVINTIDTYVGLLDCEYNVVTNPGVDWQIGCLTRIQFPPNLPNFPRDSSMFRIPWGSPCRGPIRECEYDALIPDTGSFFDDIKNAIFIRATTGQCPDGYRECTELGFDDHMEYFIYPVEQFSIETGVDLISFFRSNIYSAVTIFQAQSIGLSLLPLIPVFEATPFLQDLPIAQFSEDLLAASSTRDLRYVGEIVFRFENNGVFPRSKFHDFCVGWGYSLAPFAAFLTITFLVVQVLFLIRLVPIATRVFSGISGIIQSPLFLLDMRETMLMRESYDETIIVYRDLIQ